MVEHLTADQEVLSSTLSAPYQPRPNSDRSLLYFVAADSAESAEVIFHLTRNFPFAFIFGSVAALFLIFYGLGL